MSDLTNSDRGSPLSSSTGEKQGLLGGVVKGGNDAGDEISKLSGGASKNNGEGIESDGINEEEEVFVEINSDPTIRTVNGFRIGNLKVKEAYPAMKDSVVVTSFNREYIFFSGNRGGLVLFNKKTGEFTEVKGCEDLAIVFMRDNTLYIGVSKTTQLLHQSIDTFLADPEHDISSMVSEPIPLISAVQASISEDGVMFYVSEHKLICYNIASREYKELSLAPHPTLLSKLQFFRAPVGPQLDWVIRERRSICCEHNPGHEAGVGDSSIDSNTGDDSGSGMREDGDTQVKIHTLLVSTTFSNHSFAISLSVDTGEWTEASGKLKGTPTVELGKDLYVDWTGLLTCGKKKLELLKQYPLASFVQPLKVSDGEFLVRLENHQWATLEISAPVTPN